MAIVTRKYSSDVQVTLMLVILDDSLPSRYCMLDQAKLNHRWNMHQLPKENSKTICTPVKRRKMTSFYPGGDTLSCPLDKTPSSASRCLINDRSSFCICFPPLPYLQRHQPSLEIRLQADQDPIQSVIRPRPPVLRHPVLKLVHVGFTRCLSPRHSGGTL